MELLGLFWFLWALLRVAGYPLRKTSSYQECFPLVSKMRLQIVSNWPFNSSYILKIIADVFPPPALTHTLMLQTSKLIKPLLLKELTLTNYQLISESDDQHLAATWYKWWGHFFFVLVFTLSLPPHMTSSRSTSLWHRIYRSHFSSKQRWNNHRRASVLGRSQWIL